MASAARAASIRTHLLALAAVVLISACATVPQEEYDLVAVDLENAQTRIDEQDAELASQADQIAQLQADLQSARQSAALSSDEAAKLQDDLNVVLVQLGEARESRLALQDEIDDLERQIERLGTAAAAAQRVEESVAAETASGLGDLEAPDALAAAIQGGSGFARVSSLGLQDDARARARLAIAAPGIGVDSSRATPVLHDTRLEYDSTILYLTIIDPQGRRPRLELTAQYATDVEPLYLRTAFVTIDGGDPIDPVDPIVLAGETIRQTDGTILREAITIDADRSLVNRLSSMVSSDQFRVTYVGLNRQITHQPSVAERAALSNILFAYIDLGGLR